MTSRIVLLALVAAMALPAALSAHPLAPSLLELQESADGEVRMLWKISLLNPQAATLVPRLSPECALVPGWVDAPASEQPDAASLVRRYTLDCAESGLVGRKISIDGLDAVESSILLRVVLADGATARAVLRGGDPPFLVSGSPTRWQTAADYLVLGFEHILGGFDHLLFVLGLLFLIDSRKMLLLTVTAFTVGHSITLSLAALDWVRLPSGPVELAIAASIWWVAVELAHKGRASSSFTGQRPWLMAGIFGLLHGFGFAGALAEAGLPQDDILLALLSFNVGIELGQLAFIAVVLIAQWTLTKAFAPRGLPQAAQPPTRIRAGLSLAASYVIGVLATYWCLQRGSELLTML